MGVLLGVFSLCYGSTFSTRAFLEDNMALTDTEIRKANVIDKAYRISDVG
jgi:hypothetical protein